MMPLTAKTIVRVPFWLIAQRKVPSEPSSASEVTVYTVPPAPPVVYFPAPSAPGKAGTFERSGVAFSLYELSVFVFPWIEGSINKAHSPTRIFLFIAT